MIQEIKKLIKNNVYYIIILLFSIPAAGFVDTRVSILTGDVIDHISDSEKVARLIILLALVIIVKYVLEQINLILKRLIAAANELYLRRRMQAVTLSAQFSQLQQWK